jgi:hypothetical protein
MRNSVHIPQKKIDTQQITNAIIIKEKEEDEEERNVK